MGKPSFTPQISSAVQSQGISVRQARLPLNTAVQWLSAYQGPTLQAEDFAGTVLSLAAQQKSSRSLPQSLPSGADAAPVSLRSHLAARAVADESLPESLSSMHSVALSLQAQGRLAEAEALMRQALDSLKVRYGVQDAHTLRAQNSLACLLQNQGRYVDARRLYLHTVELQRRLLGTDHLDTIATLENLGTLLYEQDELDNAAPLMHDAVVCRRRLLGDAHPDTLRSFNNLALLLQKQGKLAAAELVLRQTLVGQGRVLGPQHSETLTTQANLAIVLEDLGRHAEAEIMHRDSLAQRRVRLGGSHPETLTSMNNLAAFLMAQKQPAQVVEAADLLKNSLIAAKKTFPVHHYFYANLQARYGSCLTLLQQHSAAESHLLVSFANLKSTLGAVHPRTQRACRSLVQLYQAWGKSNKVEAFRKELTS
jgi:tetratricopeptide (TPR) repeat protein